MDKLAEVNKPKFSPRDGLKVGLVGIGALAAGFVASKFSRNSVETDVEGVISINTDAGSFYPIPDTHGLPYTEDQLKLLPRLDAVVFEYSTQQSFLVNGDAKDIMLGTSDKYEVVTEGRQLIPENELVHFAENGTNIFFEGQIPGGEGYVLASYGFEVTEFFGGMGYMFKRMLDVKKSGESGGNDKFDLIDKAIVGLGIEPLANFMAQMVASFPNENAHANSLLRNSFQRVVDHLTSIGTVAHPEIIYDLFRVLNLARQQLIVANDISNNSIRISSPKIGYKFGAAHGASVEDCLRMGEDFIYSMLDAFPKVFWEKMVKINGGIEITSTTPIFEPRFGGASWTRILIKDKRYEDLLRKKLE